jgi:hypothetical protein
MLCIHPIKGPVCRRHWRRPAERSGNLVVSGSRRQMGRADESSTSTDEKTENLWKEKRQVSPLCCSVLHALWARSQVVIPHLVCAPPPSILAAAM